MARAAARGLRRARGPVLDAAAGEERDEPVRQHVQEVVQRGRAAAQRLRDHLGVVARQHAGGTGQAHQPDGHLGQAIALLAHLEHIGRRIDQAGRRAEPHGLGRILRPPRPGQYAHRGIEAKPPAAPPPACPARSGASCQRSGAGAGGRERPRGTRPSRSVPTAIMRARGCRCGRARRRRCRAGRAGRRGSG